MLQNQVNRPAKDLCTVNTSPQIHSSYSFHCLLFCILNFVSKLYSGRISDKEIVNVSGFLERKEEQRERITKDQEMLDMSLDIEWLDWLSDNLTQEDN